MFEEKTCVTHTKKMKLIKNLRKLFFKINGSEYVTTVVLKLIGEFCEYDLEIMSDNFS